MKDPHLSGWCSPCEPGNNAHGRCKDVRCRCAGHKVTVWRCAWQEKEGNAEPLDFDTKAQAERLEADLKLRGIDALVIEIQVEA